MFRRARWLILLAIFLIIAGLVSLFLSQKNLLRTQKPAKSAPLPANISATAEGWTYTKSEGDRVIFRVKAKSYQQVKEPSTFLLGDLELEIHDKKDEKVDVVKTGRATFDTAEGTMFAEGQVRITMGLPKDGATRQGRIIGIESSRMSYDSKTMRVTTEERTTFQTDRGDGEAVGADYDPATRELHLHREVKLRWRGRSQPAREMQVEAGELVYKELLSQVLLFPWARLKREAMTLEGNDAVVFLNEGLIERVETRNARGSDRQPGKDMEYGAEFLKMEFTPKGEVRKIEAIDQARLSNLTAAARTTVTGDRIDLEFDPEAKESTLTRALSHGDARVESRPVERAGVAPPPTRTMTSEVIEMNMRRGGKEIDKVVTHAPGQIEFLPNRAGERKRRLSGERLYITYGPNNAIESFRAVNVTTRTETPPKEKGKPVSVAVTASRDLQADFDPRTGQMVRMEQWPDFRYEEGARKAQAERATLDQTRDIITLKTGARMSDAAGSTSADEIVLDQSTGDFAAVGNVASVRAPEEKKPSKPAPGQAAGAAAAKMDGNAGVPKDGGMLSGDEPLQARAHTMLAKDRNRKIRYEGKALLWQGASRLQADVVDIDREAGILAATGSVVSEFPDQKDAGARKKGTAGFTVIHAGEMTYSDKTKQAVYRTGVVMERTGLEVKSNEMRAWFREEQTPSGTQSKLERIFADGAVDIISRSPDRTRRGGAEHTEYYLEEDKVILTGGNPFVNDTKRGITRGALITWYSGQDRMIVDSSGSGGSVTRILKKKK